MYKHGINCTIYATAAAPKVDVTGTFWGTVRKRNKQGFFKHPAGIDENARQLKQMIASSKCFLQVKLFFIALNLPDIEFAIMIRVCVRDR